MNNWEKRNGYDLNDYESYYTIIYQKYYERRKL